MNYKTEIIKSQFRTDMLEMINQFNHYYYPNWILKLKLSPKQFLILVDLINIYVRVGKDLIPISLINLDGDCKPIFPIRTVKKALRGLVKKKLIKIECSGNQVRVGLSNYFLKKHDSKTLKVRD